MSTERNLLAASAADRDAYVLIERHVDSKGLTAQAGTVLAAIGAYYDRDPAAQSCDREVLTEAVLHGVANPKHKETFTHVMDGVFEADVSSANVANVIMEAKREAMAARLSTMLAAGDGDGDIPALMESYLELNEDLYVQDNETQEEFSNLSFKELVDDQGGGDLIKVFPSSLNKRLGGGILRKEHMILFARPEMGKTATVVNMMGGFAVQGCRTAYINNEEPVITTALRCMARLSGMTYAEAMERPEEATAIAREKGYENLVFKEMSPGTPREVEEYVRRQKPDVLIVDQIRNLVAGGGKNDNFTRSLETNAQAVRQIGKRNNCAVISITQAGESAEGKAMLDMTDIDSSKTGLPGACDILVGLGASREDVAAGRRVFSLAKNKRAGVHEFFPVSINLPLSKLEAMG